MRVHPAELTLTNGTDTVTLRPFTPSGGDAVFCQSWDLGAPEVRYTTVPNPGADGVTESNGYTGSRTVVIELQIIGNDTIDPYWVIQTLTRMTHPQAFPELSIERLARDGVGGSNGKWIMSLRGNPYSLVYTRRAGAVIDLQLSFTCPGGYLETALPRTFVAPDSPDDDNVITDWIFPAVFPKGFGLIGGANATYPFLTIPVGGDTSVAPVIYISGPVTDPEVRSDTRDVFKFDGLTLTAGETVIIYMGTGDILLTKPDSSTVPDDMSAYGAVDWAVSTYWTWAAGMDHTVEYRSMTGGLTVKFRERRFTI